MNTSGFTKFINSIRSSLTKHAPEILTGIGIAGMLTTTVLAVRATPKALRLMDEELLRQNNAAAEEAHKNGDKLCKQITKLKPIDVVKVTWKCYLPPLITAATSTACLIGASSVHARRNAALATVYKLSETALSEYKDKVIETVGEKKEKLIRDKVSEEKVKNNPVSNNQVILSKKGDTLCYETISGQYFKSDVEAIRKAVNEINKQMLNENYVSLNDFYSAIGIKPSSIGEDLGWKIDNGFVEVYFSTCLSENDEPCLVISYEKGPVYDYYKFM